MMDSGAQLIQFILDSMRQLVLMLERGRIVRVTCADRQIPGAHLDQEPGTV